MQTFAPQFMEITAIYVSQVIFDRSEWVSIWGSVDTDKGKRKMDFVTDFDTLNQLLRFSGQAGDDIQMHLVDKLEGELQEPSVVDLENLYGSPLLLNGCRLKVYHPREQDARGQWTTDRKCLFIDEVMPLLEKKTIVKIRKNLYRENLEKCLELLSTSYEVYLGFLEIGLDEDAARQKSELADDTKFKMAYYMWKGAN